MWRTALTWDYFDVEDLGRLRRSLRKAIGDTQRERELYQEIVQQYIEAGRPKHAATRMHSTTTPVKTACIHPAT